jgi:hypothetical protein
MVWIFEIGVLLVVGTALRRLLRMGKNKAFIEEAPRFRRPANNPLCSSLVSEMDTHTTILGVVLNDAIEELASGNAEIARRMLNVFDSERERLVELVINLQNLSLKYLPTTRYPVETRSLDPVSFRSQPVNEFFTRHGVLDQFVFRAKLRFQLQLRLLRRATVLLNESFEELKLQAETDVQAFGRRLAQMDLYFHDLDLLTKETLLGFSTELASIPEDLLEDVAAEIVVLTSRNTVTVASPLTATAQR